MLHADRNRGLTRAYTRAARRGPLRSQPEKNLACHATLNANPVGWLDALDYGAGEGAVQTPVMKVGSATQANAPQRPFYSKDSWSSDNGPAYNFIAVANMVWGCGTSIDIGGGRGCTIIAACNFTATGTTGQIWEYTTAATGADGAYIAFRRDGGVDHPFAVNGSFGAYSGGYLVGSYAGADGVIVSAQDRSLGTQLLQVGGEWEGSGFNLENGTGVVAGTYAAGASSWIGARNNGTSAPWNGKLRELVVCATKLNADQLASVVRSVRWRARVL